MTLPKVLIVGQPFNNNTGGGITLSNLFNGWDRDRIAVTCPAYLILDNIDSDKCNNYYQLGYKEHKWIFPFNLIKRKYYSGILKFDENRFQDLTISKSKLRVKIIMKYFYPFLEYLGLFHGIQKTVVSPELVKWLKDFDPDVIYAQTATRDGILFCLSIHSCLKKPFVFHMMDDWPSTISSKGLFKRYWERKIDSEFRNLLDQSDLLMSISDKMATEYRKRYNKDFITFHNTIDLEFWKKYQRTSYEINDRPSILYAGRIGLGIDTSLELIAKAIDKVNYDQNISVRFILQTQEKPLWAEDYGCVEHTGFVSYEDLPKVFSGSDFLLLPYDFSKESIKYIKLSMPTKAPEYMVSGTPVLLFAPEETAVVDYAKAHEWAYVITENNIINISEAIKKLVNDRELRMKISQNAIKVAETNHNSTEVTNRFKKIINSLTIK